MRQSDHGWVKKAATVSVIGVLPLVSTGIGLFLGSWIDSKLGTFPWFSFALTLVGLASGVYETVRILIEVTRDDR